MKNFLLSLLPMLLLTACVGIPDGVQPVNNFDLNRYLGKWYEIARLDHSFERGLTKISAEYSALAVLVPTPEAAQHVYKSPPHY